METKVYHLEFSFKEMVPLSEITEGLTSSVESLNEMSEMTSLRLQMTMDRRSKSMATLAHIMKAITETQETLVKNLE